MKRKFQHNRKGKKHVDVLRKLTESVEEFIRKEGKSGGVGDEEETFKRTSRFSVKKKSRKELRREKRKAKKIKRKTYCEGKRTGSINAVETVLKKQGKARSPLRKEFNVAEKSIPTSSELMRSKVKGKAVNPVEKGQKKSTKLESSKRDEQQKPKKKSGGRLLETRRQALLEANAEEDREIKRLEKQLGLNRRKNKKSLPQSFTADGLDYVLGILEPGAAGSGLYESDEETEAIGGTLNELVGDDYNQKESEDSEMKSDPEESELSETEETGESDVDEWEESKQEDSVPSEEEQNILTTTCEQEESKGFLSAQGESEDIEMNSGQEGTTEKYIPPHLQRSAETVDSKRREELERLKRSVNGLINRLSEANIASICSQFEELYMAHSRKDMNDTLTDVLLVSCVIPNLMPTRLLMEHILLISILHHTVGMEVGAHFLETIVRRFDVFHLSSSEGKESDNLLAMIAHMYNFNIVHCVLMFDILKKLLKTFTEKDIELILFLLKNVGFSLRKDDPLALKEIISEIQCKAGSLAPRMQEQPRSFPNNATLLCFPQVRFMLETLLALKNNDIRKIPGYDPEPVDRLRKLQRILIHNNASGSDVCLRVTLDSLLTADQVGRWWIVGSSWSGAPMLNASDIKDKEIKSVGKASAKILDLARKQRMNTDIRRNIFCVLMTSEDFLDAFEKLLRLGLKEHQQREIVHVLVDCCLQEKSFNPYYAVLAEKFCSYDRQFQMTIQFTMWDKFRDLANLSSPAFSNLVNLLVHFLKKTSLSLSVLKIIEFSELDKVKVRFLRQVLSKLLTESEPEDLISIFGRISGIDKLTMLREGLKLFISHFLLKNTQILGTAEQANLLRERATLAEKALEAKDTKLKL
ncbi:NOM1 protein, partial [Polypterus senegalus]